MAEAWFKGMCWMDQVSCSTEGWAWKFFHGLVQQHSASCTSKNIGKGQTGLSRRWMSTGEFFSPQSPLRALLVPCSDFGVGVGDIRPLNKSSKILVQRRKRPKCLFQRPFLRRRKAWRTPEESPQRSSDPRNIGTRECAAPSLQGWQGLFPALFSQGTKLWGQGDSSFLSHHMQFETQSLYSRNIAAWVNPGAGTQGCSSKQRNLLSTLGESNLNSP